MSAPKSPRPRLKQPAPQPEPPAALPGGGMAASLASVMNHSVGDYLLIIRDRWAIGLVFGLLAAILYGLWKWDEVPVYYSETTLLIEHKSDRVLDIDQVVDTTLSSELELRNHEAILNSQSFLMTVANAVPEKRRGPLTEPYITPEDPNPSVAGVLAQGRRFSRAGGTLIFKIGFAHRDPEMAAYASRLFAKQYIASVMERADTGTTTARNFLRSETESLKQQLADKQAELQAYTSAHDLSSIEEMQTVVANRMARLHTNLTELSIEQLELSTTLEDIELARSKGHDLTHMPAIAAYANVATLVQQQQELQNEKQLLNLKYLEAHPRMIDVEARIDTTQAQLANTVRRAIQSLQQRHDLLSSRYATLQAAYEQTDALLRELDAVRIPYDILRNDLANLQRNYNTVNARYYETEIAANQEIESMKILDPAGPNPNPISPDKQKIVMMSILLFGVVFAGLPIAIELLNNKLHSEWDIRVFLGRESLGDILQKRKLTRSQLAKAVIEKTDAETVDSFRTLYGHLGLASEIEGTKSIVVSSTMPNEGKTFVSCNLAGMFSLHGKKVLLIDCDFRRPSIDQHFGFNKNEGFLRWWKTLKKTTPVRGDLFKEPQLLGIQTVAPNFDVLPAGGKTDATSEIFTDPRYQDFLGQAYQAYEAIIFDTPPTGLFSDSVFLAELADEIVFVVRHNAVARVSVKRALSQLDRANARVLGVVLNAISRKARDRYGYSGYQYMQKKHYYTPPEPEAADDKA
jgi:capsular exopolysaccharide synthesis family protein